MTPHRLTATAALHSLGAAYTALRHAATVEAAQIAAAGLDAPDGLRSPVWGGRHGSGGHSDPTATTYLAATPTHVLRKTQTLCEDIGGQLAQLAAPLPGTGAPLDRIGAAIPSQPDHVLGPLTDALTRLDQVARRHLRMPPARDLLPGDCPHCAHRRLEVSTAGPETDRIVVCRHCNTVWPKTDVIAGVVAGATPTHTTRKDQP